MSYHHDPDWILVSSVACLVILAIRFFLMDRILSWLDKLQRRIHRQ